MYYVYYKIYWSDENPFSIAYLHIIWVYGYMDVDGWMDSYTSQENATST